VGYQDREASLSDTVEPLALVLCGPYRGKMRLRRLNMDGLVETTALGVSFAYLVNML